MGKNKISSFLTPDISYLLGLITGRGEISATRDVKKIIIDFEFKTLVSKAITKVFEQKLHIQTSLDTIIARLYNMGVNIRKDVSENKITIVLHWDKEDISWLFIKFLINGTRFTYHNFLIPEPIFETTEENKKEFLRGISDVTGYVRASNYLAFSGDLPKRYRVYIEISNKNWFLPPQLCFLLQSIDIPLQTINYGHPNMRDPKNKKGGRFWAKEHQIKIFAEDFKKIGFYISHKNEALQELAEHNLNNFKNSIPLCNGVINRIKNKPIHPDETDERLPKEIRGKHFNNYQQICKSLNCYKQK